MLVVALTTITGCVRVRPVYNVKDAAFARPPGPALTMEQVSKAIWTAGQRLKWQIQQVRPGELTGTLNLRSHVAVVSIRHDTSRFSIQYKDSTNLMYSDDQIHRNYNNWIHNLEREIQVEIAKAAKGP